MKHPKISIIHPTRGRKKMALDTASKWLRYADNPWDIEYIISVDDNDTDSWMSRVVMTPKIESNWQYEIEVVKNNNRSAIDAINFAAQRCIGNLIIVVSDDFSCEPHWDTILLKELKDRSDFIVKTQDGLQPTLITLPIIDRKYYERFGYVYFGEYGHMWCDNEMTAVGHLLGRVINSNIMFRHDHYITGAMPMDDINIRNNSTWVQGETLFNERLKTNFGLKESEIVNPYSSIQWR